MIGCCGRQLLSVGGGVDNDDGVDAATPPARFLQGVAPPLPPAPTLPLPALASLLPSWCSPGRTAPLAVSSRRRWTTTAVTVRQRRPRGTCNAKLLHVFVQRFCIELAHNLHATCTQLARNLHANLYSFVPSYILEVFWHFSKKTHSHPVISPPPKPKHNNI